VILPPSPLPQVDSSRVTWVEGQSCLFPGLSSRAGNLHPHKLGPVCIRRSGSILPHSFCYSEGGRTGLPKLAGPHKVIDLGSHLVPGAIFQEGS